MSKTKTHVMAKDGTDAAACGVISVYRNALIRAAVTCPKCKKTSEYKRLTK